VGGVSQRGIARLRGDVDTIIPPVPQGVAVAALSKEGLSVSWTDQAGESGWKLERSTNGVSGWVEVATLPWDVTNFEDSGLNAATKYYYRLRRSMAQV
jgi:hypothetical protein